MIAFLVASVAQKTRASQTLASNGFLCYTTGVAG